MLWSPAPHDADRGGRTRPTSENDDDQGLEALLKHIKEERGFDFTGYKRASLARRVQRRIDAVGLQGYDQYLDHLLLNPDEFTPLFNTILINVTSFFRDPESWAYLQRELLPPLLQRRQGQPIRVWSAGCASGEEACTMAMVLAEALGIDDFRDRVKIYATDVDEEALAQGRQATYTGRDLESVPEELREKYFEMSNNRFVFRKELRRSLIFGRNDLIQDAPISHVDLLLCRNALMYFNAETQSQILNRLHFALRPDGILFLGKAEMLLSHSAYFRPVELKQRFFEKIATEGRGRRQVTHSADMGPDAAHEARISRLRQAALMSSAAAQVVLDDEHRLVMCNNRAMNVFGLSLRDVGLPIQDLEVSYRPLELRGHIEEAVRNRRPVWVRDVELVRGAAERFVLDVQFVPLSDETGTPLGLTIIFNDVTQHHKLQDELLFTNRQLETAYEELQSTNEELETTNEELQSTVEELETTNEELQSTNEELETMNEELQSMNDELHYSNQALRERQDDVDRLNQFMNSVLSSMRSGIVVVDSEMTVLAWNSMAEDLWGIRTDEALGAHLMNLDFGLPVEQLRQPIRSQLNESGSEPNTLLLDAVNRRGRSVQVRITITSLHDHGFPSPSAVIAMEPRPEGEE
jgi:two-component system, chemotaxis family, CheB/CheR fusion protein